MTQINSFSGFLLLLGIVVFSFVPSSEIEQQEQSLLWEISGKKVNSPSYIFGTMHLISNEKFYFPKELENALIKTELLVMELGGLSDQMTATQHLFLENGNLFDLFNTKQLDIIFAFFEENVGLNKATVQKQYGRFKPFVILQIAAQMSFGSSPKSYELKLETLAKSNNITIEGLETAEEQMAIIDNMTIEEQVEMVISSIRNFETSKKQAEELERIYLSQNIDSIYQNIHAYKSNLMNHEDELLKNRNENWIPKIKKFIKKHPTFIAVGAAHLGGETGIIELLRKEGYTLTPVKF